MSFCEGAKGLKITYDPFFRKIFNPYEHPKRLEKFLETILLQPVKIKKILSREGMQISEKGSFVIMDILVSLADGSIANVEMQKIGYAFPSQRSECYASDLTMRQYSVAKNRHGKNFSFRDLKPIFIIVIIEDSPSVFYTEDNAYLHNRQVTYDTHIKLPTLQNICYINLDIFIKNSNNILNDMDAWLTFLASDKPADILKLIQYDSIFAEMYHDMALFRRDVKELMGLYSEALKILDHNTELYMIDELQNELLRKDEVIAENKKALAENKKALAENKKAIAEKDDALSKKDAIIAQLQEQLAQLQ